MDSSKALLVKQIRVHVEALITLLSSPAGEVPPADVVGRSLLSTRMFSGSASVMGLDRWAELSAAFGSLLRRYEGGRFPWDDRIADVTSELIEKEETVVAAYEADPATELDSVIANEETVALISELALLEEECATARLEADAGDVMPVVTLDLDEEPRREESPAPAAVTPEGPASGAPGPMSGVVSRLNASFERLQGLMESQAWTSRSWDSDEVQNIRRELNAIDFCARTIEKTISARVAGAVPRPPCTLTPLRVVLSDFAAELARGSGRSLHVELIGEEHSIDPSLLSTAGLVLQAMITDTFKRCEQDVLRVEISAREIQGVMRWRVVDDGNNFVSDSRLDHDEQLAFYPGLRAVVSRLGRHRCALWVEPGEGPRARFEFTLPVSDERDALIVWGEGKSAFAVRATQVCARVPAESDAVTEDSFGQHVDVDGTRIALFRLDGLYNEAPSGGDTVIVIGSVEKRIAFFAPGNGVPMEAHVFNDAIPAWQGAPSQVASVDGRRLPLLDADHVIEAYHAATGTLDTEEVSGGVLVDPESNPRQAASRVDVPAPPDSTERGGEADGVDVLVVEQSESMRDTLTTILSSRGVRSKCVKSIEEAIDLVESSDPRLIISEFRMPTMAAKRIVDALGASGRNIPVLVTTSQTGPTADLLVEKLGASGYVSKPINPDDVASTVSTYFGEGIPS
jgi:CheY-like chemotaxis protein